MFRNALKSNQALYCPSDGKSGELLSLALSTKVELQSGVRVRTDLLATWKEIWEMNSPYHTNVPNVAPTRHSHWSLICHLWERINRTRGGPIAAIHLWVGGAWSISFVINECVSASARSAQESRLRRDGLHAKDGYEAQRLGQFAHECT